MERIKKYSAEAAVIAHFEPLIPHASPNNIISIGIGSGTTIIHVVNYIAKLLHSKAERNFFVFVPTSLQATDLILAENLKLGSLLQYPELEIVFDGADQIDSNCNMIKGGGGCHTMEKIVASASKRKLIIIADESKLLPENSVGAFTRAIPIEVVPVAKNLIYSKITQMFPHSTARIRESTNSKVGPVISDLGNIIMDLTLSPSDLPSETISLANIHNILINIPGVIETGIFTKDLINIVYIGTFKPEIDEIVIKTIKAYFIIYYIFFTVWLFCIMRRASNK